MDQVATLLWTETEREWDGEDRKQWSEGKERDGKLGQGEKKIESERNWKDKRREVLQKQEEKDGEKNITEEAEKQEVQL